MTTTEKGKIAIYWAAGCGGCEISFLGINEKLLELLEGFDLVFCPCVMDTKVADVEAMPDKGIDLCLFNGGIRNSEQEYMAKLLRDKSKLLLAFGSCAHEGCIPGLANITNRQEIFDTAYGDTDSTDNAAGVRPQPETTVDGCTLHLPEFYDNLRTLADVVRVDYILPGCPPEPERIWEALCAVRDAKLPAPGSVIGRETTVCDECPRTRDEKRIKRFYRTWEIIPDEETCLLEQGLICAGIATRAGCDALCPKVNSPCIGCYGPNEGVDDFGARLMSALASVIDSNDPEEIEEILTQGIPDPVGTFYRFGLAHGLLKGAARVPEGADAVEEGGAQ